MILQRTPPRVLLTRDPFWEPLDTRKDVYDPPYIHNKLCEPPARPKYSKQAISEVQGRPVQGLPVVRQGQPGRTSIKDSHQGCPYTPPRVVCTHISVRFIRPSKLRKSIPRNSGPPNSTIKSTEFHTPEFRTPKFDLQKYGIPYLGIPNPWLVGWFGPLRPVILF